MAHARKPLEQTLARTVRIDDRMRFGSQQQGIVSTPRSVLALALYLPYVTSATKRMQRQALLSNAGPRRQGLLRYAGAEKQFAHAASRSAENAGIREKSQIKTQGCPQPTASPCLDARTRSGAHHSGLVSPGLGDANFYLYLQCVTTAISRMPGRSFPSYAGPAKQTRRIAGRSSATWLRPGNVSARFGRGKSRAPCALHAERVLCREQRKEESHATERDHRTRGPGPQ